jgi:4a-hydroxytetrahydrobiopterin dehydratase
MNKTVLSAEDIQAALGDLPGWKSEEGALTKAFVFGSFREAFGFMTRVAFEAEGLDHHPDWSNGYDTVRIRLSTHSVGNKITAKDVELARRIQRISWVG